MQALSRRDREALRHREEIMAAAEQVFAEKGFYNATMEDIAQASEFAIGSLYKHFRSKDAIFLALFQEKLTMYVDGIETLLADDTPFLEQFERFLNYYADFADHNQAFFRLFHRATNTADWQKEDVKACIEPNIDRYARSIKRLMERGRSEGHLRDLDVTDLTAFTLGALQGFLLTTWRHEDSSNMKQKVPLIRSLLLAGAGAGQQMAETETSPLPQNPTAVSR